jgi:chromosome segregation ATPase
MDDKISKLQAVTDEAEEQVKVCKQALDLAETQLNQAKQRLKSLPQEEQELLQVNDTELPELLDTHDRAHNLYESLLARYNTNKRYLDAFKEREGK